MKKIRALIIDDSALTRKLLHEILSSDSDIEVVGSAMDPYVARDRIKQLSPDVLTLDVEMPRMDGLTFLSNLMRLHPIPVVMVSSLTQKGADVTLRALELGAIDFVSKPTLDVTHRLEDYRDEIIEKVKIAAKAKVRHQPTAKEQTSRRLAAQAKFSSDAVLQRSTRYSKYKTTERIIAIGASTGGTEAVKEVISEFPASTPAVVVAQHIPAAFTSPWAARMDSVCAMKVVVAEDRAPIVPGTVYIAPGSHHLIVERNGARWTCRLNDGPPVNRHKPSVMFCSAQLQTPRGATRSGRYLQVWVRMAQRGCSK